MNVGPWGRDNAGMAHRRLTAILSGLVVAAVLLTGCGGASSRSGAGHARANSHTTTSGTPTSTSGASKPAAPAKPKYPPYPRVLAAAEQTAPSGFRPAVQWHGQTAAWVARTSAGITLLSFNQRLVDLHLHSGTIDAGASGWRWGPAIAGRERRRLIAAFNGGFRLNTDAGGFEAYGRTAVSLRPGLGSIVTYTDGTTDIGSWGSQVPAHGKKVASVRQNLSLLINRGSAASSVSCVACWGATLGGVSDPARSALGITGEGRLMWAGGEHLTPAQLAQAMVSAHVVRAVELDINPEWVNAYVYGHRHGHGPLAPVAMVPGQNGIPGEFLTPWGRDFFSVNGR